MHADLFRALSQTRYLTFHSHSGNSSQMGWNHHGTGTTTVRIAQNDIYFDDNFVLDNQRQCHDKKLWRFLENGVEFHHFRNDQYEKIFEFVWQNGQFHAVQPYCCRPDDYHGSLNMHDGNIIFTIAIKGTRKDERIEYVYHA